MGTDTRGISIPGFEIVEELGRGARSAVYRARRGDTDYAVKVQLLQAADADRAGRGFRREAAIIAALRHPCLGQVYEVGEAAGHAYMVMELIEGRTLADLLADGPLTETHAVDIASDVASALAAAHRVGVVHRDIKPRNIVVGTDGHAKLIDFGLAAPTGITLEDAIAGTVLYTAPEQAGMLRRPVDGRSDLYSLGAVLFECLAGHPLFQAEEAGEVARMHAVAPAPDLRSVRRDLSTGFARIVARLLAKDPDDRYQSAEALLGDLSRLSRGALDEDTPLGIADDQLPTGGDTPLVGRAGELSVLVEALAEARRGSGIAVLVESEPGCGKTRLVTEATRLARFQHVAVLEGRCVADSPIPFAPLRQAVDGWLRSLERRELRERARLREALRLSVGQMVESLRGLTPALDELLAVETVREDLAPQETTGAAIVQLLVTIARVSRGAVLVVDGVHAADDATRRVLQRLALEIGRSKLLVILTARNDPGNRSLVGRLVDELGAAVRYTIELPRLDDAEIAEMLAGHLGGGRLDPDLARELTLRSNGNPAAAIEYLRAALDGGVIRPSWGSFVVDRDGLARLGLPSDVLQLELQRLDSLEPAARELLAAAAVIGPRFDVETAASVTRLPPSRVRDLFGSAQRARLVGPAEEAAAEGERWAFLHDGVRESLLAGLDADGARHFHEMAARAIEASGETTPSAVFEMAIHFGLGDVGNDPVRAFQANYRAARLAVANDAIDEALRFFDVAEGIALAQRLAVPTEFHEDYGNACLHARLLDQAGAHFEQALLVETDRRIRSRLFESIARVHYANADTDRVLETIQLALNEIGARFPSNPVLLALDTTWRFFAGIACSLTRIGFGRAKAAHRERFRTEVRLLDLAGQAAYQNLSNRLVLVVALRSLYPVSRLGPSREYVGLYSSLSTLLSVVGLRPLARLIARRVRRMAERLGDSHVTLHTRVNEALSLDFEGHPLEACDRLQALLRDHGRYLDPIDYQLAVACLCIGLALRGYVREAAAWYEEAARRMHLLDENRNVSAVAYLGITVAGILGQPTVGLERIDAVQRVIEELGATRSMVAAFHNSMALFHFGLGELGQPFEDALAGFSGSRIRPMTAPLYYRPFWIVKAFARLAQSASAPPEQRRERLAAARRALIQLRLTGRTPVLRGHFFAALADYHYQRGRYGQAMRVLRRAERHGVGMDAPSLEMEQAALRSLVLAALGHETEAGRLAESSRRYAELLGVQTFVRWIRPAGEVPPPPPPIGRPIRPQDERRDSASATGSVTTDDHGSRRSRRNDRQLEALLQVSTASARTLDPEEIARVALDETVRILGAERALLFLVGDEGRASKPHLGRDASRHDLTDLSGYSSTIVDRVLATREAIVLTGTEEGAALGSESAVAHGLRSILVAPLQLEDRLLGVVYLDNRLAKGVFTADDVEILVAITNHVAIALETARLAHVELSVQAERNQREIAEMLRDSMHKVSQSLEPEEVLINILSTARLVLGADTGAIVLVRDGKLQVACALGTPARTRPVGPGSPLLELASEPEIAHVVTRDEILVSGEVPPGGRTPIAEVIGTSGSWLAVPLEAREVPIGALVLGTPAPGAYGSGQAELAAALAGQGVVAYENAQLFSQVQTLAQVDELSGVATRRHFFELGSQSFDNARRYDRPLSALMLDIDYFKLVNDRHGHASGDDVIRAVASRIGANIRSGDVLGRLGGEEFALVLHESVEGAVGLAERLRAAVSDTPIETEGGLVRVTISVGVATLMEEDTSLSRLLQRTDLALYEAKRSGRNQVCFDPGARRPA